MKISPSITLSVTILVSLLFLSVPAAGTSTSVHIVKYAADGVTVLNETTVDYRWMEQHLPVLGDGSTHYYLQGPVFVDNPDDRWNPAEDTNVQEKDMGAVKGTSVASLCDIVGGMEAGEEVIVRATDGLSRAFAYENIYEAPSRQGTIILAWYQDTRGYVPSYSDGMRLLFLADSSTNPFGIHAMGAWDWHESADEQYWYYYYDGNEKYPTTTGLSVQTVGELAIMSQEEPAGFIRVVSDPSGAKVLIDGDDTGLRTPYISDSLAAGTYSIGVELEEYEIPDEIPVDVEHGTTSEVRFSLVAIEQPSEERDISSGEPTGQEDDGDTGDPRLFPALSGTIRGILDMEPVENMEALSNRNQEFVFTLPERFQGKETGTSWLVVFARSREALPEECSLLLDLEGRIFPSERAFEVTTWNRSLGYPVTYLYNLTGIGINSRSSAHLKIEECDTSSLRPEGAVWITSSEDTAPCWTDYRIYLGAAPVGRSGEEQDERIEISVDSSSHTRGSLLLAGTGRSPAGNPQINVQWDEYTVTLDQEWADPVSWIEGVATMFTAGTPRASSTLIVPGYQKNGPIGEIRIAAVSFCRNTSELTPISENVSIQIPSRPSGVPLTSLSTSAPTAPGGDMGKVTPTPPMEWQEEENSFFDRIVEIILSFLFVVTGSPGTPSAIMHQELPDLPDSPGVPGGVEEVVTLPPSTEERTPEPTRVPAPPERVEVQPQDTQIRPIPKYGAIYLTSHPSGGNLKIDGKKTPYSAPSLVYGLKQGAHTVVLQRNPDGGGTTESLTSRVWVYPGAVTATHFDLVSPVISRTYSIRAGGNQSPVTFTVNGFYPARKTPAEIDLPATGGFITALRNGSFYSIVPRASYSSDAELVIPAEGQMLYQLSVSSMPQGAEIFVDGVRTTLRTPVTIGNISSGPHRILLSLEGYLPGETLIEIPIDDSPVVREPLSLKLERYPSGPLTIDSTPEGGTIVLGGITTGEKTPCTFPAMPIGVFEIRVSRGDEVKSADVIVQPGEGGRYHVLFDSP